MNLIAFAVSLVASLFSHGDATKQQQHATVGYMPISISTVSPDRLAKFKRGHVVRSPYLRPVIVARHGNRVTRTLAGDSSGQTVTYTERQ